MKDVKKGASTWIWDSLEDSWGIMIIMFDIVWYQYSYNDQFWISAKSRLIWKYMRAHSSVKPLQCTFLNISSEMLFYQNFVIRTEEAIQIGLVKVSASILWMDMFPESHMYYSVNIE